MNKRKIEVVQQALVLFREKGIIQTSIQDIIECSGISKGTFYNYFKNKNECVYATIEHMRYEASLIRSEIQLGKSIDDVNVLVEQMIRITSMNQQYGLPALFEQMLHSMDKDLKEYVMLYRIHEIAWLSNRIIDLYGEGVRPHSFEIATLFYGMMHNVKFLHRFLQHHIEEEDMRKTIQALVSYLKPLIAHITVQDVAVLNQEHLEQLLSPIKKQQITKIQLMTDIDQFKIETRLTKHQQELLNSISEELEREELRTAVISALLPALVNSFSNTAILDQIKQFHMRIWVFLNEYK